MAQRCKLSLLLSSRNELPMTTPNALNEYNAAELPAQELLEKLGWTYILSGTPQAWSSKRVH